jgi:integrase
MQGVYTICKRFCSSAQVNIREIQQLLGHKHVETTMIYTHVMRDIEKVPKSPLDMLSKKA